MQESKGGFSSVIPPFPDGAVAEYQVVVTFSDGSTAGFPNNPADEWYQLYTGPVTPLFCSSFEGPPEAEGWSLGAQWQQGAPTGQGGDPTEPSDGSGIIGLNLAGPYSPDSNTALTGPQIATQGFPVVRLQYRRWLGVEDGTFDDATISANGKVAWQNFDSQNGDLSKTQHRDLEWRFHDVDLTPFVVNDAVQLEFRLQSDGGLEFAGWNIDQLCVVGTNATPSVVCGDGLLAPGEACDNGPGNSDSLPDACRTNCTPARCGDLVIDSLESCDDGNQLGGDGCSPSCQSEPIATTDVPTTSAGDDTASPITATASDTDTDTDATDSAGTDLADRGCACDSGTPEGLPALGLGLLVLFGLRRRPARGPAKR
jgi:MYXO-CTERM domain-containing protein